MHFPWYVLLFIVSQNLVWLTLEYYFLVFKKLYLYNGLWLCNMYFAQMKSKQYLYQYQGPFEIRKYFENILRYLFTETSCRWVVWVNLLLYSRSSIYIFKLSCIHPLYCEWVSMKICIYISKNDRWLRSVIANHHPPCLTPPLLLLTCMIYREEMITIVGYHQIFIVSCNYTNN